jgi:hypothetical protein
VSLSAIPKALRQRLFERDRGRCSYCRLAQVAQVAVFHINHIIPKSKGGLTEESNLALQCPHCSLRKSDKVASRDPVDGIIVPLFHPLLQRWDDHFALTVDGRCRGLSTVGRATIEALRMNDPLPRIARLVQIRLGWLNITVE